MVLILGILGITASVISFQCKKNRSILFFRSMNELLFGIQYILLGAYTGAAMNAVGCIRNTLFSRKFSKEKPTVLPIVLFSIFFVVFGIFTWQGPKSILIIFAKVLSTIAYGNKNTTIVRSIVFVTCSCWLVYNLFVGSYTGFLCEAFSLASLVAGIVRLDILPRIKQHVRQP